MDWHHRFNEHDVSLIEALNEKRVSFLIVGGTAVAFHGCREIHAIDDLDMLIDPTIENAKKFVGAVTEAAKNAGLPLSKVIDPVDMTKPKVQFPFKFGAFYSEFLTPNSHKEFDDLTTRAHFTKIGIQKVNVVSLPDIVAMKIEAVRDSQIAFEKHSNDLKCLNLKLTKTQN